MEGLPPWAGELTIASFAALVWWLERKRNEALEARHDRAVAAVRQERIDAQNREREIMISTTAQLASVSEEQKIVATTLLKALEVLPRRSGQ